ncbi:MAG TPA: MFS transporter [Thermoplasmata archaeon]|nr:MFS transporter [Thermoplasmata archaeon]
MSPDATDLLAPARTATVPDPRRAATILAVLAGAALLVNYVETMLVPALPTLAGYFGNAPYTSVAWIISVYLLVGVTTTPVFAKLGDIYGKKRMLVTVLGLYAAAVVVAPLTPALAAALGLSRGSALFLLIAARGLQGTGLAMFPLAFALVGEELPANRVAPAQGLISAMFAVGAAAGLFGGAWIIQTFGWIAAYEAVVVPVLLVLALAIRTLPESRHRLDVPMDLPGAALLGATLSSLMLAITLGPSWGWGAPAGGHLLGLPFGVPEIFALSYLALVGFVVRERRTDAPIFPLARLRNPDLAFSYLAALLVGMSLFLAFVALTVLVELPVVGLGRSVFAFGVMSLPTTLAMFVAAPLVGRAIVRFGPRPLMMLGSAISTAGFLLLFTVHSNYVEIVLEAIPTFVGMVTIIVCVTNVVVLSARRGETGIQTGLTETFQDLGASVGPVVVSSVLTSITSTYLVRVAAPGGSAVVPVVLPSLAAFEWIFGLGTVLVVACGVLGSQIRNYQLHEHPVETDGASTGAGSPATGA